MRTIYNIDHNLKHDSILKEPVIPIITTFDEEGFEKLHKDFDAAHRSGQKIIPLIIDSYGGQAYSLLGMIAIIQSSKIPVVTVLLSKAMSCGSILFSFGKERYMSPHATLMIHDVSSIVHGKTEEIKSDAKEVDRINEVVYDMFDKNCNQPKGFFKNMVHERSHADWYIDTKEALKLNLATHIGIPSFNINIKIEYNLSI